MGALTRPAQIDELLSFAEAVITKQEPDAVIVSLDSLLYGGLITGRRSLEDLPTIMARLDRVKKWKTLSARPLIIMAQSSIMRISDNYDNSEEKEYWSQFGREIFEWSACLHRLAKGEKPTAGVLESLERRIPAEVRQDYLDTRRRNFAVNMTLLKNMGARQNQRYLDYLIFSQDDSGQYGLNVSEKERLIATSGQLGVTDKVAVYAGADEVLMTLLARLLIAEGVSKNPLSAPGAVVYFSPAGCSTVASRYEGQDIGTTVATQIQAAGLKMTTGTKDDATAGGADNRAIGGNTFTLIIHGPSERQGDHINLPGLPDLGHVDTSQTVAETLGLIERAHDKVLIADVAYANGGDPKLVEALLKRPELLTKINSYGGWNTTGNTMGSTLAVAIAYWFARMASAASDKEDMSEAHKQCLFVRFVDDWAYQACVREQLGGEPSTQKLAELIGPYIGQINSALAIEPSVRLSFPWKRTFEIEIGFEGG
jgi:hypothetical protein